MDTKLKKKYQSDFHDLRQIVNSWNLIPDSPDDEFDSVTHLILSQLYQKKDYRGITKRVFFELSNNYGLSVKEEHLDPLLKPVFKWWEAKYSNT